MNIAQVGMYLKVMWVILREAILHPCVTSYIRLDTAEVYYSENNTPTPLDEAKMATRILTGEQIAAIREIIRLIAQLDLEHEAADDYDANTVMVNEIYYCGVTPEEFESFYQIIRSANDPQDRSPK